MIFVAGGSNDFDDLDGLCGVLEPLNNEEGVVGTGILLLLLLMLLLLLLLLDFDFLLELDFFKLDEAVAFASLLFEDEGEDTDELSAVLGISNNSILLATLSLCSTDSLVCFFSSTFLIVGVASIVSPKK